MKLLLLLLFARLVTFTSLRCGWLRTFPSENCDVCSVENDSVFCYEIFLVVIHKYGCASMLELLELSISFTSRAEHVSGAGWERKTEWSGEN